jgi:DNA-binding transcriptional LysR family regulator
MLQKCKPGLHKLPRSTLVWDDLKYFALITQEASIARAARNADIEHSTLVRRINRLEAALGLRLFNRLARGWVLTTEGEALRERVLPLDAQVLELTRFSQTLGQEAGPVVLSAPPDLLSQMVTPALSALAARHPQIELRLIGTTEHANLSRGEADIALRMAKVEGAELVCQKLCTVSYGVYGRAHWANEDKPARRFIGYAHACALKEALDRQAAGRDIVLQTNSPSVALQAAAQGLGLALLPTFLAAGHPELTVIETPPTPITHPVYVVMQRDVRKAKRVRAVVDHLRQHMPRDL